jgi:hypothetical protein
VGLYNSTKAKKKGDITTVRRCIEKFEEKKRREKEHIESSKKQNTKQGLNRK